MKTIIKGVVNDSRYKIIADAYLNQELFTLPGSTIKRRCINLVLSQDKDIPEYEATIIYV
jgi:hypothetical protein